MKIVEIDNPTEDEWVVTDNTTQTHYYAKLFPASGGRHQLVIAQLGSRHTKYELLVETYSITFYTVNPLAFASHIIRFFTNCQNRDYPVELVFAFGGSTVEAPAFYPKHKGAYQ